MVAENEKENSIGCALSIDEPRPKLPAAKCKSPLKKDANAKPARHITLFEKLNEHLSNSLKNHKVVNKIILIVRACVDFFQKLNSSLNRS